MIAALTLTMLLYTPAWEECLDRSSDLDWFQQEMREWEWKAAQAVIQGRVGKGPVDYLQLSRSEIAVGWFHLTAQRDPLGLNIPPSRIHSDSNDYWSWMQALYSDQAPHRQLEAWRRLVRPAIRAARAAGWTKDFELVAAAANSSPVLAIAIVERCRDACCFARRYIMKRGRRSNHRVQRVRLLGYGRCL